MAKPIHTGDIVKIRQWFYDNPGKETTSVDLAEQFELKRWQVNNAIAQLLRKNIIKRGERFNIGMAHYTPYSLRAESEKREEFKVTEKALVSAPKPARVDYPVLVEYDISMITPQLREWLSASHAPLNCVQAISANTAIVWNSPSQREFMRQMALSQ